MKQYYRNTTTSGPAIICHAIFYHNSLRLKTSVGKYNIIKHSYAVFFLLGYSLVSEFYVPKFRRWEINQKKEYNIQNAAKV
jgi:hypothetical protein